MAPYEGLAQHLEHILTLVAHGIGVGTDGAEGLCIGQGAKATGDFQLHLAEARGQVLQCSIGTELTVVPWRLNRQLQILLQVNLILEDRIPKHFRRWRLSAPTAGLAE